MQTCCDGCSMAEAAAGAPAAMRAACQPSPTQPSQLASQPANGEQELEQAGPQTSSSVAIGDAAGLGVAAGQLYSGGWQQQQQEQQQEELRRRYDTLLPAAPPLALRMPAADPPTLSTHPARSGPREDATRIGSAGVVRRQAVDVSPLRRVNQAIWLITTGARESAFRNIKTIAECLADELINAAKGSSNRFVLLRVGMGGVGTGPGRGSTSGGAEAPLGWRQWIAAATCCCCCCDHVDGDVHVAKQAHSALA